jgi:hypothetical protein
LLARLSCPRGPLHQGVTFPRRNTARLGVDVLGERCDAAAEAFCDVEAKFDEHIESSVLALGAVLMMAIKDDCEEAIVGLNRAALAAIRPQLVSAIAQDADRALAQNEEAA